MFATWMSWRVVKSRVAGVLTNALAGGLAIRDEELGM